MLSRLHPFVVAVLAAAIAGGAVAGVILLATQDRGHHARITTTTSSSSTTTSTSSTTTSTIATLPTAPTSSLPHRPPLAAFSLSGSAQSDYCQGGSLALSTARSYSAGAITRYEAAGQLGQEQQQIANASNETGRYYDAFVRLRDLYDAIGRERVGLLENRDTFTADHLAVLDAIDAMGQQCPS